MDPAEERHRLAAFPTVEVDPTGKQGNVLLSDEIEAMCKPDVRMIDPFDKAMVRAASYRLRVGEQYRKGNAVRRLEDAEGKREIVIAPGEMVVLQTKETINLPRFIIARWNMKTDLVYKGLLWVGGPQVDPGWLGRLQCPIYNLSNQSVTLKLGDPFAIMDFQRTTPYTPKACFPYPRPPRTVAMEEYQYGDLGSSPTEGAVSAVRTDFVALQDGEAKFTETMTKSFSGLVDSVAATKLEQDKERDELRKVSITSLEEMSLLRQGVFTVMTVFVAAVGTLATAVAVFVAKNGAYVEPTDFTFIVGTVLFGSAVTSVYAAVKTGQLSSRLKRLQDRLALGQTTARPEPTRS